MSRIAIVCIDDQQIILECLQMQLERYYGDDFILEYANTGVKALAIIDSLYDSGVEHVVVVCDLNLGAIRGDELLNIIHAKYPQAGKILLSGYMPHDLLEKLKKKINLNGFVYKPWDVQELVRVIDTAISDVVSYGQGDLSIYADINRATVLCVGLEYQLQEKVQYVMEQLDRQIVVVRDADSAFACIDDIVADGVRHLVIVADYGLRESELIIDAQSQFVSVKFVALNGTEDCLVINNQVKGVKLAGVIENTHSHDDIQKVISDALSDCLVCV